MRRWLALGVVVVVAVSAAITMYVNATAGDPYASFHTGCTARPGATIVTLSSTTRSEYMGGGATKYTLGCRDSTGAIVAKVVTNHR